MSRHGSNRFEFYTFSEVDNSTADKFNTDLIIEHNGKQLSSLMGVDDSEFVREWKQNLSFQRFIQSYLSHRCRPTDSVKDSNDLLSFDSLVFGCFMRLFHHPAMLEEIDVINLPNILSLGCIMGDSNMEYFAKAISDIRGSVPGILNEIATNVDEVVQTVMEVYDAYVTITSPRFSKKQKFIRAPINLLDLSEYVLDICDSVHVLLVGCHGWLFDPRSKTYMNGGGNLGLTGVSILKILVILYEKILPLLQKCIGTDLSPSDCNRLKFIYKTSQRRCLQNLFSMLSVACEMYDIQTPTVSPRVCKDCASSGDVEEGLTWTDAVVSLSMGDFHEEKSGAVVGAMMADTLQVYGAYVQALLDAVFSSHDPEQKSYILSVIGNLDGYLRTDVKPHCTPKQLNQPPENQKSGDDSQTALERSMQEVKAIFPDYGDFFVSAVLKAYDYSVERAIDALLTDNLPPTLANMDRNVKAAFMGKSSTDSDTSAKRAKGGKVVYKLELKGADKQQQKERLRMLNKQMEDEVRILEKEYGDDYDDQFDDAGLAETWQQTRDRVIKLNTMIRSEEVEAKYWEDMKNTNKKGNRRTITNSSDDEFDNSGSGEEDIQSEAATKAIGNEINSKAKNVGAMTATKNTQPHSGLTSRQATKSKKKAQQGSSAGAADGIGGGKKSKFRTKTFDKHHQKDKSTRKFGGFM